MSNPIRVVVTGDTATMRAELGLASSTLARFGETAKVSFGAYSTSALQAQIASDKLALSLRAVPAGSTAAAESLLKYQRTVDGLRASQMAAAKEIGTSMSKYITAPTLLAAAAAVKLGTDFQTHMLLIQTQAGASAAEVKNLSKEVLNLARNGAQQGPVTLSEGLYHLESLGLRGAKAMDALKVSSDAAALGMASLEDVASALGGVVVTGIRGSQDYSKAMGTLNATIGAGNMTMSDLIGFLGTGVVPAAKNAGISLTELGAAAAVLTDRGVDAESAGTRLRMTFALMQDPSNKARKSLADMGIDADVMAATLRKPNGLLTVLRMLHDGMASVGNVRGSRDILASFGGGRSGAGILTLIQSLDSAVSSYQGKVAQVARTSGDLQTAESAQQKTAAAAFHRDIASMEASLTSLGGRMLPAITLIANGVGKIGDAFGALPAPVKDALGGIVVLLAAGGPLFLAILGIQKGVASIGRAFGLLPAEIAPGIAAANLEVDTIGATAEAQLIPVADLRAGLLGLGDAEVLGSLGALAVGGAAALAVLGPLAVAVAGIKYGGGATPRQREEAAYPLIGVVDNATKDEWARMSKRTVTAFGKESWADTEGWITHKQAERWFAAHGKQMVAAGMLTKLQLAEILNPGGAHDTGINPGSIGPDPGDVTGTDIPPPRPTVAPKPTLTAQQQLDIGLALNPTDLNLLRKKLAEDNAALAFALKQFQSGAWDATKYKSEVEQYGPDRSAVEAEIASITHKATAAGNSAASKRRAAATRAQRAHLSGVETRAQDLANALHGTHAGATSSGGIGKDRLAAYDALIDYYKSEAHDAKLTSDERANFAAKAIAARTAEVHEAQKNAADYERILISNARTMVASAHGLKEKEAALRKEIGAYATAAGNKSLTGTQRATYRTDEAAARAELSGLRDHYTTPVGLQLAEARDQAENHMGAFLNDARKVKAAALRAIRSGQLSMQGMIDAWNVIAQANSSLGGTELGVTAYKTANVIKLTSGLGLTHAQRVAEEMRFAQASAHRGRVPTGPAAQGYPLGNIHIDTVVVKGESTKQIMAELQRIAKRVVHQRGGRYGGVGLGLA